ncbi:MAG: NosD domain-containing protein [Nitrososphaerota archaeon]
MWMMEKSFILFMTTLLFLMNIVGIFGLHDLEETKINRIIIVPYDYQTIQEAIRSASTNDIIYVKKGIYKENIIIDKTLWLVGEDPEKVIIDGGGRDFTIIVKAERVIITRVTITGGGLKEGLIGRGIGLELHRAHGSRIMKNVIKENRMGIYLHSTYNAVVADNIIKDNREGVYLYNSINNHILNNTISDNEYFAIQLFSSTLNNLMNNTISRNSIGIYFYRHSTENMVKHNKVKDGGIFIIDSINNKFLDNILENRGLYITESSNKIENNILNGKPLIYLEEASDRVIEDAGQVILFKCSNITLRNLRIEKAGIAVILWNTNSSRIINGTLSMNEVGIYLHISSNNNVTGNILSSNIIGIRTYMLENSIIYGNKIIGNRYGIVLEESYDNQVIRNMLAYNMNYGMLILHSSRNSINSNEFYNNSFNIFAYNSTIEDNTKQ